MKMRKLGDTMSTSHQWQEIYRTALLEIRPEALPQRIHDAEQAILKRIVELRSHEARTEEELRSLDDALRGLRVLARSECQIAQPPAPNLMPSRVTS